MDCLLSMKQKQQEQHSTNTNNKKMKHSKNDSAASLVDEEEDSAPKRTNSRTALDEMGKDGSFKRTDSAWRNWITPGGKHPPAAHRYHIFVAAACPWAHRVAIVRKLKGLEGIIGITTVMPVWQPTKPSVDKHCGWVFAQPGAPDIKNSIRLGGPFPSSYENTDPEPFYGCKTVRDLYDKANDEDGTYYCEMRVR